MATWPVTLPATPLVNGYREVSRDSTRKFDPDLGAPKEHNRFTAVPSDVTEQHVLTEAQWLILESFFNNDCNRGPTTFFRTHPFRGVTREYKFKQPPTFELNYPYYVATLELELLP